MFKTIAVLVAASAVTLAPMRAGCTIHEDNTGLHIIPTITTPSHPSEQAPYVQGKLVIQVLTPPREGHVTITLYHKDPVTHVWIDDGADSAAGPWYIHHTRILDVDRTCSKAHPTMRWRMRIQWRGIATDGTTYTEHTDWFPNKRVGKSITCS